MERALVVVVAAAPMTLIITYIYIYNVNRNAKTNVNQNRQKYDGARIYATRAARCLEDVRLVVHQIVFCIRQSAAKFIYTSIYEYIHTK